MIKFQVSNSNWTEWSTIQGVIRRVISKSDKSEARGRFENTSAITPWLPFITDEEAAASKRLVFYVFSAQKSIFTTGCQVPIFSYFLACLLFSPIFSGNS